MALAEAVADTGTSASIKQSVRRFVPWELLKEDEQRNRVRSAICKEGRR